MIGTKYVYGNSSIGRPGLVRDELKTMNNLQTIDRRVIDYSRAHGNILGSLTSMSP
jgi:hypothetical protein